MEGCGSPAVYESQPGETRASPMAGTPLREPWSAQMRRCLVRRPLTRPDHTEFGPLRPGDLGRSGSGRAPRMLARQWVRRLCGLLRARGVVAARAGEKRGDALVPMAHSVGGGEIPGFSRGNGNFADFPRERPFWRRKQRTKSSPCQPIPVAGLNGNWRRPNRELKAPNRELNRRMPPATAEHQKRTRKRPITPSRRNAIKHKSS
jgi:hypothetical protein